MPPFNYASPDSGFWDTLVVLALGGEDLEETAPRLEEREPVAQPLEGASRAGG